LEEGDYLGQLTDECKGLAIEKYVGLGSKCYAYITEKDKNGKVKRCVKTKGIKINSVNNEEINYELFKRILNKEGDEYRTKTQTIQKSKYLELKTVDNTKLLRATLDKRVFSENGHSAPHVEKTN
jgi:transposase